MVVGDSHARLVVGLAVLVRVALFPLADNKQGDAPIRALIAERLNIEPGAAADPRTYCQFGPLHLTLMRPFLWLDGDGPRSSRELSLLAGLLTFVPFLRLGRRLVGAAAADTAGFALAVSPLHVQLSITAASEALYLLLVVAALERLLAALDNPRGRTFAVAGLLASLSSLTRYDAWLMWPAAALGAWVCTERADRPAVRGGLLVFLTAAALLPLAWLWWSAVVAHDPFFFVRHISRDHARLGTAVSEQYGAALARARQLGIWLGALAAVMTPALLPATGRALRAWRTLSGAQKITAVTAIGPPLLYLLDGLISLHFEPLARFALVPGALLLPLAAAQLLATTEAGRARRWIGAAAALGSAAVLLVAWAGPGRGWGGAESLGPLTRLDAEDRQLAAYLHAHRRADEPIMVDPLQFMDIAVTHASGTPAACSVTLVLTRQPGRTVAGTLAATGARWLAVRDDSWAPRLVQDWPAASVRFGRWRLIHVHVHGAPPGPDDAS